METKKIRENGKYHIGMIGVDSGQIMIVDPCYLKDWKNNEYKGQTIRTGDFSYDGACRETVSKEKAGELGLLPDGSSAMAVVAASGYGDGLYDVFATYKGGRIKEIQIKFDCMMFLQHTKVEE